MNKFIPLERDFVVFGVSFFAVENVEKIAESEGAVICFFNLTNSGDHIDIKFGILNSSLLGEKIAETLVEAEAAFDEAGLRGERCGVCVAFC